MTQKVPGGQSTPQLPQSKLSESGSTHTPEQSTNPVGHPATHVWFWHTLFGPHATPHPPQFWSVVKSVHVPPQQPKPAAHANRHWPQLLVELSRSTHPPWQQAGAIPIHVTPQPAQLNGDVDDTQTPLQQISPGKHWFVQEPHALGFVCKSTHPNPVQNFWPVAAHTQTPFTQICPARALHTTPVAPQNPPVTITVPVPPPPPVVPVGPIGTNGGKMVVSPVIARYTMISASVTATTISTKTSHSYQASIGPRPLTVSPAVPSCARARLRTQTAPASRKTALQKKT